MTVCDSIYFIKIWKKIKKIKHTEQFGNVFASQYNQTLHKHQYSNSHTTHLRADSLKMQKYTAL